MQVQTNRPDSYGPMYCSQCQNRVMRQEIIGRRLVFACEHNVVYGATLTSAEISAAVDAARKTA